MRADTFSFAAPGGLSLFVYRWLPDGDPRALVQIVHGMAEHAGRYAALAEALTEAGYAVYAHDQRGHGRSVTSSSDFGHMADLNGWNKAVEDCRALSKHLRGEHEGLPQVLLGHSMGSFLARRYAVTWGDELAGLALSGTGGVGGALEKLGLSIARWRAGAKGRRATSRILKRMTFQEYNRAFKPSRTDFDWLSRDEAQVDAYIRDPHCGFDVSLGTWVDLLAERVDQDLPERLEGLPAGLPVYLFSGDQDPLSEKGKGLNDVASLYRAAGVQRVDVRLYSGARHEILNESNRAEVFADLLTWVEDVTSSKA